MSAQISPVEFTPEILLARYPAPIQQLASELRTLVHEACPSASERAYAGWRIIAFAAPKIFCYINPGQHGVALGFNMGKTLPDPAGLLKGEARLARSVLLQPGQRIPRKALRELVEQAFQLAQWSGQDSDPAGSPG